MDPNANKPRVLCICQGGNCRSVGLAEALKGTYGCDAIAAGASWASQETMLMLCRWADVVIAVEPPILCDHSSVNQPLWESCVMWDHEFASKLHVFDVGADIWSNPRHTSYQALIHLRREEFLPWINAARRIKEEE